MNIRRILFGYATTGPAGDFGMMILRAGSGLALAFLHGKGKVPPSEGFINSVAGMGFPMPEVFAWLSGFAEFFGGLLLAIGLLTRPAALFIVINMAVAFFIRHAQDEWLAKEKAMLFLIIAIAFLFVGAGRYGIDALIAGRK